MTLSIAVLLGTVREDRRTGPLGRFVTDQLDALEDVDAQLFDPRELPFGNLEEREWEMDSQPEPVRRFVSAMADAGAFVLVTPEYNHGYPGALKNILDHLYDEWQRKPFGLVTCGGSFGGVRAGEMLRVIISGGLGGVAVPYQVSVQRIKDRVADGRFLDEDGTWTDRVGTLGHELVAYAQGMQVVREQLEGGAR